jgi:hypothetical protein
MSEKLGVLTRKKAEWDRRVKEAAMKGAKMQGFHPSEMETAL